MSNMNGMDRVQLFALEIIALISGGEKETISIVEQHMGDGDLVQYIRDKYCEKISNKFDDENLCNLKAWNEAFTDYYGYVQGNEDRKWGIVNEEDGLLLVVALIISIMTER